MNYHLSLVGLSQQKYFGRREATNRYGERVNLFGLTNISQTSYFNSVLQALFSTQYVTGKIGQIVKNNK